MIRRLAPAAVLLLAACASDPVALPSGPQTTPPQQRPNIHQHGALTGLTVSELGELLGSPTLQVREGAGLKLQYRGGGCVLDTYFYVPANGRGVERLIHAEARLVSGVDTDVAGCEAEIERLR